MSLVIGLLRIVFGIAVLGLTGRVYLEHRLELTGTKSIFLHHFDCFGYFDYRLESDPQLLVLGLGIAGLIGVLALCAGLYAVTHWPERAREDDHPKKAAPQAAVPPQSTPTDGAT